jgi:uncharacterized membrane protein
MSLWDPIFIYDSVVALFMMIILGYFLWKHHPKQISVFVGYRTSYSTKSIDTWNYAHEYCGRRLWILGWVLEMTALIINLHIYGSFDGTIMLVRKILPYIQLVLFFIVIIQTEVSLRKNFTKDGARK